MKQKVCSKCNEKKEVCEFQKRKNNKDGLDNACKFCRKMFSKLPENAEKIRLRNNIWNNQNKEYFKEYRLNNEVKKNKEKNNEYRKKYREKNKEKINQKQREWRNSNKEKVKKYYETSEQTRKQYIKNNVDKVRVRRNNYFRLRRNYDPLFKISLNLRTLINLSLTKKGYSKNTKSYDILGISYDEVLSYFEGLFENWMTWDNYGKYNGEYNYGWDIDHIIPLCSAKNEDEIIKLNHFTNLQPLCSKINREIKKDKY
jgi:hypothetical protein